MFTFGSKQKSSILTGVVTGTRGIAVARVQQQKDGHSILETCLFEPAASDAETDLGPALKGHGLDRQHCATVLPLGDYQLLIVEAPEVPPAELRAAIRWRIQDMIDFHIDDAVLDVFDAPASGPADAKKQLYVVVATSTTVRQHIDRLEQAGVNLEIIDIPELALRNIAARLPEDAEGIVTLYLDQEQCLITLTHEATLYLARNLDIGYRQLQESAASPQSLCNRLALEIQRSMDYYERQFRQAPIKTLAIMPVPVMLYGLEDALQQSLGLQTRTLSLGDIVECDPEPDTETAAHCLIAVGTALRSEPRAL